MYRYRIQFVVISECRDQWLDDYYFGGQPTRHVPGNLESALKRKLQIIHAAEGEKDLMIPPGNRFEHLNGKLKGWCSIRVNKQYRLVFQWDQGEARGLYLDPHTYR